METERYCGVRPIAQDDQHVCFIFNFQNNHSWYLNFIIRFLFKLKSFVGTA